MRRWNGALFVVAVVAVVLAAGSPASPAAAAVGSCDQVVVDPAHVLGSAVDVSAAAAALTRDGAVVRVRTYRSVPDGDLDAALRAEVARCASWHDGPEARRPELLVVAVDVGDRKTAISYGSRWTEALDAEQERVQSEDIDPLLRQRAYGAAIAAGLRQLHALVTAGTAADTSGTGPGDGSGDAVGDVADGVPEGVVIDGNGQPVGLDPLASPTAGPDVGALVGFGFIGVAALFVVALVARSRRGGSYPTSSRTGRGGSGQGLWASGADSGFSSGFDGSSGGFSSGFSGDSGGSGGSSDGGGGGSTSW